MEIYLKALIPAKTNLEWVSTDAKKLAYQIQEGLSAAEHLGLKQYASLRDNWKFKLKGNKVIAEYQLSIDQIPSELTFQQADPFDVIEILVRHKAVEFDLYFPNAIADPLITDYCTAQKYSIEPKQPNGILIKKDANT